MSLSRSLTAFTIVVLVIAVIFLSLQIQNNSNANRELRIEDQDLVKQAAELIVQSATQTHPVYKFRRAIEAQLVLDQVIRRNNTVGAAEKNLKLKEGKLSVLRDRIEQQHHDVQAHMMDFVLNQNPHLNVEENELAGLSHKQPFPKKSKKHRSSSSQQRRDRHR